jgi:hypothetical protein
VFFSGSRISFATEMIGMAETAITIFMTVHVHALWLCHFTAKFNLKI